MHVSVAAQHDERRQARARGYDQQAGRMEIYG